MYKILAICGKSASGKDTFLRELLEKYPLNKLIWSTTRPRRKSEIDGIDYYFEDDDYAFRGTLLNRVFNSWNYSLDLQDLATDNINVLVASPADVRELSERSDIQVLSVKIDTDDGVRIIRSLQRTPDMVDEILRRFEADKKDFAGFKSHIRGDYESCMIQVSGILDNFFLKSEDASNIFKM